MSEETEIVLQKDVYVSHCDDIVIIIKSGNYAWECGEQLKSIIEYECKEYGGASQKYTRTHSYNESKNIYKYLCEGRGKEGQRACVIGIG